MSWVVGPDQADQILGLLGDIQIRQILLATQKEELTALDVSEKLGIAKTTAYRKIADMKEAGLLMVDRFEKKGDQKEAVYVSAISEIVIQTSDSIKVTLTPSAKSQARRWFEQFYARP